MVGWPNGAPGGALGGPGPRGPGRPQGAYFRPIYKLPIDRPGAAVTSMAVARFGIGHGAFSRHPTTHPIAPKEKHSVTLGPSFRLWET